MKEFIVKHKGLVICLSVGLVFILTLIILTFTLFSLKNVEIEFKNEPIVFASSESKSNITENKVIKIGTPIFALNKKEIKNSLEKEFEYLEIVNIETSFPNKIIIHCAEREETFAVKASSTKYFICDADFKVLKVDITQSIPYTSTQENAILLDGVENLILNTNRANAGDFLEFSSESDILEMISSALLQNGKDVSMQRALFERIELDSSIYYYTAKNQPYLKFFDFNGFETDIYVPESYLTIKMQVALEVLSSVVYNPTKFFTTEEINKMGTIPENYYLSYNLKIEQNLQNKILTRIVKNV